MSTTPTVLELPCPSCATISLVDEKLISCKKCGFETRRLPLKAAYDYATFVFRYGHQCKQYYEDQLKDQDEPVISGNIADPHSLHKIISLPILCGVAGTTSMFLVKAAITTMVKSYNERHKTDYEVPDEDIKTLYGNFRVFVNNFADSDPKIRNSVFEEMFMAECSKKDAEKIFNLQNKAKSAKGDQQAQLKSKADKLLNETMRTTFKKIGNKPKPSPEELSAFWLKVID